MLLLLLPDFCWLRAVQMCSRKSKQKKKQEWWSISEPTSSFLCLPFLSFFLSFLSYALTSRNQFTLRYISYEVAHDWRAKMEPDFCCLNVRGVVVTLLTVIGLLWTKLCEGCCCCCCSSITIIAHCRQTSGKKNLCTEFDKREVEETYFLKYFLMYVHYQWVDCWREYIHFRNTKIRLAHPDRAFHDSWVIRNGDRRDKFG